MNFLTHNGTMTIVSKRTGDHRTIKCDTIEMYGQTERVVSLLVGPDNVRDYQAFAWVKGGEVRCWRQHADSPVKQFLAQVATTGEHPSAEVMVAGTCRRCGKKLTTKKSILEGIGPVCAGKEE